MDRTTSSALRTMISAWPPPLPASTRVRPYGCPRIPADLDGDGDTAEAIPIDLKGNQRVRGGWIDMGAYEYELAVTAGDPSPIDRADDVSRDVVLAWQPGVSAQTHNVYLGTSWDDVDAASPTP